MADQGGDRTLQRMLGLLRFLSIIGLVSLLLMIGLGVGMFMLWAARTEPQHTRIIVEKPGPGKILDLGDFIVNLADQEASRYARVSIDLEYSKHNQLLDTELHERIPQIDDLVNTLLNERTAAELETPEGKERFRRELQLKINTILKYGAVTNVFFTQFAIQ
jgi:flagellar FliL protein